MSTGSGGWNCISTVCNTFCSHWSLSMELFWNSVCDISRVPYLTSLRSTDTTFNGFTFNVMAAGLIFNGTSKLHCRTNSRPFGWIAVFTLDAPWQVYRRCNIFASSQFYFIWYYPAGSLLIITSLLCCLDNYYQALYCICIYIELYMGYDVWHIVSCQTFSWISTGITISAYISCTSAFVALHNFNHPTCRSCHVYEASVFSCWRDLSMGLCLICSVWTSRESMWALVILGNQRARGAVCHNWVIATFVKRPHDCIPLIWGNCPFLALSQHAIEARVVCGGFT